MRTAIAALAAALGGCVQLDWTAYSIHEPAPREALAVLAPGDPAEDVFDVLGAPTDVWESIRDRIVLVWAHDRTRDFGLTFSAALRDSPVSPSLALGDERSNIRGLVVILDAQWRVIDVREGRLADVAPPRRLVRFDEAADPTPSDP